MRQASWEDIFRQGEESEQTKRSLWSRVKRINLFSWEDVVTLAIVLVAFLTVVRSVDNANWVAMMPSLYEIGFLGLGLGLLLAFARPVSGLVAHITALVVGVVSVGVVVGLQLEEGRFYERGWEILERLWLWGDALVTGGISNDNLPFVVLVVSATFITAYLAAWSIFRWQNAWVALVPGGVALLTNISYLPGQNSLPLLIYLFCAILLLARVHLLRRVKEWKRTNTRYPDFISLSVLNVTVWVGLLLLAVAWILPVGSGSGTLYSLWVKVTAPVVEPMRDLGRVFSAVDAKRGGGVHQFGPLLPLQGGISLGGGEVMRVTATETGFLRGQSYDFYTPQGWRVGDAAQITAGSWEALRAIQSVEEATQQLRRHVSLQVTTTKRSNVIVSQGQPLSVNIDTRVVFGSGPGDVMSVRPASRLEEEDQYRVDSTVSNASANNLREAPASYPSGIEPYLQLPSDLPQRVADKAREVSAGSTNPYDIASDIERFLRTYPVDMNIGAAPPREDSVDYFLFELQRGYFDYHASAMVVMLRSVGIPARLTVGYVLHADDRVPQSNIYVVHERNAFAWPEVYFPGLGWVEFNPTPSEPLVARSGVDGDFFPGFDPNDMFFEEEFFMPDFFGDVTPASGALDEFVIEEESSFVSRIVLSVIVTILGITMLGFVVFHFSWQHGLRGYSYPVQIWEKTLRLGRWSKIKYMPQETPREMIARLKHELPEVEDLDYLGESYIRTRYGQKELTPEEKDRLTQVWQKARNNLMARVLRWK